MKQTNNAIKMLLAQYRAVYRLAYYTGLAGVAYLSIACLPNTVYAQEIPQDGILDNNTYITSNNDGVVRLDDKPLYLGADKTSTLQVNNAHQKLEIYSDKFQLDGNLTLEGSNKKIKLHLGDVSVAGKLGHLSGTGTLEIKGNTTAVDIVNGQIELQNFKEIKATGENTSLNFGTNAKATMTQDQIESFLKGKGQSAKQGSITLFNGQNKIDTTLTIQQKDGQDINLSEYVGSKGKGHISGVGIINTTNATIDKNVYQKYNFINLNTDKLTLGNDQTNTDFSPGFNNIKVQKELVVKSKNDEAFLKSQNIELNANDNEVHKVQSDKKINLSVGSNLNFTDGSWEVDSNLQVNQGNLNIKANDGDTTTVSLKAGKTLSFGNNNPGKIIISGTDSKGNTQFDLSNANVDENTSQHAILNVKERGHVKVKNTDFEKLKKGTITLESGNTDEATIEIVGGELTLIEDDFSDVTSATQNQNAKKIGLKGTLKGDSLKFADGNNNKKIEIEDSLKNKFSEKSKFKFKNIDFSADDSTLEGAIIAVNNTLSAGSDDKHQGNLTFKNNKIFLEKNSNANDISNLQASKITTDNSTLDIQGKWDFNDADAYLANANGANSLNVHKDASADKINKLALNKGKALVEGTLSAKQLEMKDDATLDLSNGANVTIIGTNADKDITLTDNNKIKAEVGSNFVVDKDASKDIFDVDNNTFTEDGKKFAKNYSGDGSTTLHLKYDENTFITKDIAKKVVDEFKDNKGFINFGDARMEHGEIGDTIAWDDAKYYGKLQITNDKLEKARVIGKKDTIEKDGGIYGSFGSFEVSDSQDNLDVKIKGNTILSNANGNVDNKSFITVNNKTANAIVEDKVSFTLQNGGEIHDVTLNSDSSFIVNNKENDIFEMNEIKKGANTKNSTVAFNNGNVTVYSSVDTDNLNTSNTNLNAKSINAKNIVFKDSKVNIDNSITLNDGKDSVIDNTSLNAKDLNISNSNINVTDSDINIDKLSLDDKSTINLGKTKVKTLARNLNTNEEINTNKATNFFVNDASQFKGTVNLVSSTDAATTLVFNKADNLYNTANVKENSIIAYGFESTEDLERNLKENFLQNANGSTKNKKALVVFNKTINLKDKGSITLNAQNAQDGIVLGDNSSIVITDKALEQSKDKGVISADKTITIKKEKDDSDANIILSGNITANKDIVLLGQNVTTDTNLRVEAADGQLYGTLEKGNTTVHGLKVDYDKVNNLNYKASSPVKAHIAKMLEDRGMTVTGKKGTRIDNFANYLASSTNDAGRDLEVASRFAVYGGAINSTNIAHKAQNDAIREYIGDSMSRSAIDGEMGSFFMKPYVIASDSNKYETEGQIYGNKTNLYGGTLGTAFAITPDIKLGAFASLGRGNSRGKDTGNDVESDFDFYGVGAFASFIRPDFSITTDISYVLGKSDIKTNIYESNDFKKFNADVDSSALSIGLDAAYKFKQNEIDITPHGGIRYSQLKVSDYNVFADSNAFMENKFETMSVLSIPFGLSIGGEIVDGKWVVKPNLDLNVAFNLGDTNMNHSAKILTKNYGMTLNSQILDDVVLGIKASLNAEFADALTLGFGVGYEGSKNKDNVSFNANMNYKF